MMDAMDYVAEFRQGMPTTLDDPRMIALQIAAMKSASRYTDLTKSTGAITTGAGVVQLTDTGGNALRYEFIHGALANETFDDTKIRTFRRMKKVPVTSTAVQWVAKNDLGYVGDGLLAETGIDGAFNGDVATASNYRRELENIGFEHDIRQTSLAATMVDNVVDPVEDGRKDALRVIKARFNRVALYGNRLTNALSPNGFRAQMLYDLNNGFDINRPVLFDCGGYRIDKSILEEVCRVGNDQFGDLSLLTMASTSYRDLMVSLFPQQRDGEPGDGDTIGLNKKKFINPYNDRVLEFMVDPLMRANEPLIPIGTGSNGLPRTVADPNSLNFASAAITASTGIAAVAPGSGFYWANYTDNSMASALATVPALPGTNAADGAYTSNHLTAGNYYYAVAPVYLGREGTPWVWGSDGTVGNATPIAVTTGQVVSLTINTSSITGFGSTYARNWIRYRVYRYGPSTVAPTSVSQFSYLMEIGCPSAGTSTIGYDNGMTIPGMDNAYCISERDEDGDNWFFAQLLPLMKRPLPNQLMADINGFLLFGTPILKKRGRHLWLRNIGTASR